MFIKMFLMLSIVLIAALIGMKKAGKYEEREAIIRESITLFNRIGNDIKYNLTILPNAIESARQGFNTKLKDILGSISTSVLDNSYSEFFVTEEINTLEALKPYDKQVISQGIISLGLADLTTQIRLIDGTISTLSELVADARDEKNKNAKLYRTIGIVTGLMIAIVIV